MGKKLYVHGSVDGCVESFLDFSRSRDAMVAAGWEVTGSVEEADVVMVNTCVVGKVVEDRCVDEIEKVKQAMKPGAELVVTGCMPAYNKEKLDAMGVDLSFAPTKPQAFLDRFDLELPPEPVELEKPFLGPYNIFNWVAPVLAAAGRYRIPLPEYLFRRFSMVESDDMTFLRINRGCRESCSYCATKFTIGKLTSNRPEQILARFDAALAEGKRNFALCGEETGSYGFDIGTDLPFLLEGMLERKGDFLINIRQHHPRYLVDKLDRYCKVLSDPRVKSITIPLQSGSDRILSLMKRRHTAAEARDMVLAIHRAAPQVMLRTHLIAGFPTETREEFRQTLSVIRDLPWDMVLVYPFTSRPKTAADRIEPKIPQSEINRRIGLAYAHVIYAVYLNRFKLWPLVRQDPMRSSPAARDRS
jgi:tRNA A37 methylthiotransferase MiaB